jgi:two-component system, sensor histidine kinase and response regulator
VYVSVWDPDHHPASLLQSEQVNEQINEQVSEQYTSTLLKNLDITMPSQVNTIAKFLSHTVAVRDTMVFFAVRDEGPGISDEDRKNLFGKFVRLSARPTAGEHSSGLGLAIVKRFVEAMGGQVWCESVVGQGSIFFVALPRAIQ